MKAKQWTALLKPLHVDVVAEKEGAFDLFTEEVTKLSQDCMEIVKMRLGNRSSGHVPSAVITNAFAEAELKWNSVVHAVSDGLEMFPLNRGMLGTYFVSTLITKLKNEKVSTEAFDAYSQMIEAVAKTPTNMSSRIFNHTLDEYRAVKAKRIGSSDFFLEALARGLGFNVPRRR